VAFTYVALPKKPKHWLQRSTPPAENPADSSFADFIRTRLALAEYGTGEDIGGLVAFLAGEEGKYITGTTLTIAG